MPDHVHILVCGVSLQADLPAFMTHLKKITVFNYSLRFKRRLWQPGYYDRIPRVRALLTAWAKQV